MTRSESPTARDVWRLALPLGTGLAAGAGSLSRDILWARSSSHLSTLFPGLSGGELALLDLELARELNPTLTLARIVRALSHVGVAALAVANPPDEAGRTAAEEAGLPLFQLPGGDDLGRTARAVRRLITDREAQEEARAAELYHRLTQRIAAGAGPEGLLALLAELTGHQAILLEPAGDVRMAYPLDPAQPGMTSAELAAREVPVVVSGQTAARLRLAAASSELDRLSELAVEQGAAAMALELAKQMAVTQAQQALQGNLLDALLAGEHEEVIRARARALGYSLERLQLAAVAATDGVPNAEVTTWVRRAQSLAESRGWQALAAVHDQRAIILVAATTLANASSWLAELRDTWSSPETPLTLGVGEAAPGLAGLRASLSQAQDALALGLRLFGAGRDHRHADLGLYRLLRHLQGRPDLDVFYDQTLAPLVAYDDEHGGELVATLEAFLAAGGNVSRTAQLLHLHRNSLVYRLERIRQITGLDPADPENAFTLKLALLLAPLRQR